MLCLLRCLRALAAALGVFLHIRVRGAERLGPLLQILLQSVTLFTGLDRRCLQGGLPVQKRLALIRQHRDRGAALRQKRCGGVFPLEHLGKRLVGSPGIGGVPLNLGDDGFFFFKLPALFVGNGVQTGAACVDLLMKGLHPVALLADLQTHTGDVFAAGGEVCAQNRSFGLGGGAQALRLGNALPQRLGLNVLLSHFPGDALALGVEPVQLPLRAFQILLRRGIVALHGLVLHLEPVERLHPDGDLHVLQVCAQVEILPRGSRLIAQRLDLELQLVDLVIDAQKVFIRARELALGLLLAVTVAGDARRLLKDLAAVGGLVADDLGDTALTDNGIAVAAEAGVHQKLMDVAQTAGFAIDIVFTVSAAVIPAGDNDFVLLDRKEPCGIVQDQRHLRKAQRAALFRAAENDVLHLAAAERAGSLLAHDPEDRVGQIGLARAVRSDDGGDIPLEGQSRLIGKGLEALNLDCFQVQMNPSYFRNTHRQKTCGFPKNCIHIQSIQ